MMITKMSLPRRTFLRGMGTALALPLLDAMVPAATQPYSGSTCSIALVDKTKTSPSRRLGHSAMKNLLSR